MRLNVNVSAIIIVLNVLFYALDGSFCEAFVLLQTLSGSVPSGNFSYYKLNRGGNIRLQLRTLKGDADVYVSESTLHPTYEDYDLLSATCGDETVDILEVAKRPIGIGIYGHPLYSHDTVYEFDILIDTRESFNPWEGEGNDEPSGGAYMDKSPTEDSMIWDVFISILKIIIDVLL